MSARLARKRGTLARHLPFGFVSPVQWRDRKTTSGLAAPAIQYAGAVLCPVTNFKRLTSI
jgi:hypothetical protein